MNVKKTGKPIAAGILAILSGVLGVLLLGCMVFVLTHTIPIFGGWVLFLGTTISGLLISPLALIGGIFALRRKHWK
jgi:hypothetical protein